MKDKNYNETVGGVFVLMVLCTLIVYMGWVFANYVMDWMGV